MGFSIDKHLATHELALKASSQRATQLASNIANANTPGYKAKDLDFKAVMQTASTDFGGVQLTGTQSGHFSDGDSLTTASQITRQPTQASLDGNTVDLMVENAAFSENAMNYMTALNLLDGKLKSMLTAIKGD